MSGQSDAQESEFTPQEIIEQVEHAVEVAQDAVEDGDEKTASKILEQLEQWQSQASLTLGKLASSAEVTALHQEIASLKLLLSPQTEPEADPKKVTTQPPPQPSTLENATQEPANPTPPPPLAITKTEPQESGEEESRAKQSPPQERAAQKRRSI